MGNVSIATDNECLCLGSNTMNNIAYQRFLLEKQ